MQLLRDRKSGELSRRGATSSLSTSIAVAIIGLAGSLGGAWLASGAKFERELDTRGQEIRELRQTLIEAQKKMAEQQVKIDKLDGEIESAKQMVSGIASKAGEIVLQKLTPAWPFGKKEDAKK